MELLYSYQKLYTDTKRYYSHEQELEWDIQKDPFAALWGVGRGKDKFS